MAVRWSCVEVDCDWAVTAADAETIIPLAQQHIAEANKVLNDSSTKVVQLPYYLPEFNSITKTDTEPLFQKVLLGQMSAKDFLDQFAAKFTDAQAKFKQRNGG